MTSTATRGSATRERILRVATELFAANGYHATGVAQLSEAVGLGRGALYHHIASKELLLYEISIGLLERMIADGRRLSAEVADPEQRIRALAAALVAEHATNRDAWSLVINETRSLTDAHRRAVVAERDRYEAIWAQAVDAAAAAGAWRRLDEVELRALLGMLNSTARWVDPDGPLPPAAIAERYVDLVVGGVGA